MTEAEKKQRTKQQILDDESKVEELLVQSYTVQEIHRQLDMSLAMVYRHKQSIEDKWKNVRATHANHALGRLVSNQLLVQKAAWRGWRRSLENAVTETDETEGMRTSAGDSYGQKEKSKTVTKGMSGNPAYLNTIITSDRFIANILGLDSENAEQGLSTQFMAQLKSVLRITPQDFEVLRQADAARKERQAIEIQRMQDDEF